MSTSMDFKRQHGGAFQFGLRTMLITVTLCAGRRLREGWMHAIAGAIWSYDLSFPCCCLLQCMCSATRSAPAFATRLRRMRQSKLKNVPLLPPRRMGHGKLSD